MLMMTVTGIDRLSDFLRCKDGPIQNCQWSTIFRQFLQWPVAFQHLMQIPSLIRSINIFVIV